MATRKYFFGGYIDGNKNGIGVLNFESKAWYEGEFRNGIISGIGTFVFEDGRRYERIYILYLYNIRFIIIH